MEELNDRFSNFDKSCTGLSYLPFLIIDYFNMISLTKIQVSVFKHITPPTRASLSPNYAGRGPMDAV